MWTKQINSHSSILLLFSGTHLNGSFFGRLGTTVRIGQEHGPVALGVLQPAFSVLELLCLLSFEPGNKTSSHALVGSGDESLATPTAGKSRGMIPKSIIASQER